MIRPFTFLFTVGLLAASLIYALAGMSLEEVKLFEDSKSKAEQGDTTAQSSLGECYMNGDGVAQDFKKAFFWFEKAAIGGDANAQSELGNCYGKGFGVEKNEKLAASWRLKAALQGNSYAQYNVAISLMYGEGLAKDEVEAYAFLNLSCTSDRPSVIRRAKVTLADLEKKISRNEIAEGQKRTKELQKEIEEKIAAKKARK